ncbi:MAG: TIGR04066 family peptide maturation system protein [Caulobacteraceae bacterium]
MYKPKAVIYPYDNESSFLFKYNDLNMKFDAAVAVAPNGWGLTGKDVGKISGSGHIGIKVNNSFEDCYGGSDSIIIADSNMELNFDIIYDNIANEVKKGKNVICMKRLEEEHYQSLYDICRSNGTAFEYLKGDDRMIAAGVYDETLLDIKSPVIFVAGVTRRTGKFDLQLALRKEMLEAGYKVSQIGTKNFCEIFGFHSFPDFMYSSTMNEATKIIMFNRFVKAVESSEKPDVIIIGIPGGVMPINKQFTDGFGVLAFLAAQAVKPDAAILSVLYEDYLPEYFREIDNFCKYRFGYNVDCFNLSNIKFDYQQSGDSGKKCYSVIDSSFINEKAEKCSSCGKPVYNLLNSIDMKNMSTHIINLLSGDENIKDII